MPDGTNAHLIKQVALQDAFKNMQKALSPLNRATEKETKLLAIVVPSKDFRCRLQDRQVDAALAGIS
jgi:hypothetical protein